MEDVKDFAEQGKQQARSMASEIERNIKQGQEQLKEMVAAADRRLRENPWPIVVGVGVSSLLIGFLMGSRRNSY